MHVAVLYDPSAMEWACSSVGEHLVDIEGVTSSILVTPTIPFFRLNFWPKILKGNDVFGALAPSMWQY